MESVFWLIMLVLVVKWLGQVGERMAIGREIAQRRKQLEKEWDQIGK